MIAPRRPSTWAGLILGAMAGPLMTAGCVDGLGVAEAVPDGDLAAFAAQVQPVLAEQCANPSCHGQPERPLAVFAVGLHRARPADLHLDAPLSAAELQGNALRVRSFMVGVERIDDCAVLRKPLAPSAGGWEHAGGTRFVDQSDAGYRSLADWLRASNDSTVAP